MYAAVFLDRDNTLIHNDGDLGDPDQVRLIQGASSAIASLRGLGYKIVVVSNQGGVSRGRYGESDVDAVNQRIAGLVKATSGATIDRFYYCPYHPEGTVERYRREHPWRKPNPGMILQAAEDLNIDLAQSWTVGDQPRDAEAGAAAGTRTILLKDDAQEMAPLRVMEEAERRGESGGAAAPNYTARNLIEAVRIIAQQRKPETPEEVRFRMQAARRQELASQRSAAARAPDASPVVPPETPAPTLPAEEAAPPPADLIPAAAVESPAAPAGVVAAEPEPPAQPLPPPAAGAPDMESFSHVPETLRQILQELRHQRSDAADFTYITAIGVILQMIALVCFLGALLMGQAEDGVFMRWMLSGILIQLATIATLLFAK
jgi:D-glycero-D-manno-heptose 1,7-bisphosphate phosphatase